MKKLYAATLLALIALLAIPGARVMAAPYPATAKESVLASGSWVKVKVEQSGMQFLSNTFLRNLGFDPATVNVYGYGGRIIPETLNDVQVDDLPLLPVVRTDAGILFFGHSTVRWSFDNNKLTHEQNPYDSNSWYFLSNRQTDAPQINTQPSVPQAVGAEVVDEFTQYLLHEKELAAPSNSGRVFLGEDFRTMTQQSFSFDLPGNRGDASATVQFGSRVTSGSSSLSFTANGEALGESSSDYIAAVTSSEVFQRLTTTVKGLPKVTGDKLDLQVKFTAGGALSLARLDFIRVNYNRALAMPASKQLLFHSLHKNADGNYSPGTMANRYKITGCSQTTQVWDVTDPSNPTKLATELQGTDLYFVPDEAGYREFIAFEPNATTLTAKTSQRVSNQNIHAMDVPDLLIITPSAYQGQAYRVAELRESEGLKVHVLTPELLYNEFSSGSADISAFRKALKMWYDRGEQDGHSMKYCLIMSRPTYDNRMITDVVKKAGYPRIPIWQSRDGNSENTSFSTDAIIGMLEDCDVFRIDVAKTNVSVGRMPVKSLTEATQMVDKLISYCTKSELGSWRNKVMLIADDQDNNVHFDQAQSVYNLMRSNGNGANFLYDRLYLDAYPLVSTGSGRKYVEPNRLLHQAFEDGVMYIDYIGHASPRGWGHEGLFTWSDLSSMKNTRYPIIYAATCEFTRWDDDAISGGELMWLYPKAGVISFLSASRAVFISDNGVLNNAMARNLFARDENGDAKRLGDVFTDMMNGMGRSDDNKLRYMMMGDPSMRLPSPTMTVEVQKIGDVDLTASTDEMPVIQARSQVKISGVVRNADGSIAEDFNGTVEPTLYDAERVIETYGNGENGQSVMYNDRKNRLFFGKAKVTNGHWETEILMPPTIDNNYSPALLSLYAYSTDRREAHGATEKLYVYGYEENFGEDTEGPEIKEFYLNNPRFEDNDIIATSAIAYAVLEDESGIFTGTNSIGFNLTLTLDNGKVYDDVNNYFTPSDTDPRQGTIAYLLSDLEPGQHSIKLTAWDNAENVTISELNFRVQANRGPELYDIKTDCNPASTAVVFHILHDQPATAMNTFIEVYDIGGTKVWSTRVDSAEGIAGDIEVSWDLTDRSGVRVPRGIYIYRATLETPEGRSSTKAKKLAVTAP